MHELAQIIFNRFAFGANSGTHSVLSSFIIKNIIFILLSQRGFP